MFRFTSKNDMFFISNHQNLCKIQEPTNYFLRLLQTLALNPNSNPSNPTIEHNPTVSYLVNKCGLPLHSAISASKHTTLTSTDNADSVLHLFISYGFTQTQITNLITKYPSFIQSDSAKTLKPKFEFFESLGLSKPELAKVLSVNKRFLQSSLTNRIIPTVDFLKTILNTNENLIHALKRWPPIAYRNYSVEIEPNVLTLRAHRVPDLVICKLLMIEPRVFMVRNEVFRDRLRRIEKLGFGPESVAYTRVAKVMLTMSDSLWENKVKVFKGFGWSDRDILAAFKKQPQFMSCSEKKIRIMMDFYLNKLNLKSFDVAKCPNLLTLGLEKRIIPRYSVLQVLLSRGLVESDLNIVGNLIIGKTSFDEKFVTKYREIVPEISSVYRSENGVSGIRRNVLMRGLDLKTSKSCHQEHAKRPENTCCKSGMPPKKTSPRLATAVTDSQSFKKDKGKGKQVRWDTKMDRPFIELLLDEDAFCQKAKNGYTAPVYQKVCRVINEKLDMDIGVEHVRGRYRTFKDSCREDRKVEKNSGFSWDSHTERVTGNPLACNELLERDLELEKYRYKKVPYYDELAIIVGDDEATGEGGETGLETDKDMPLIEEIGVSHGSSSIHSHEDGEIQSRSDTLPVPKRRRHKEDTSNSSIDILAGAAQRIAEAIERSDMGKRSDMRKIKEELAKLDLDRSLFLEAATYLGRDPNEAHVFFGMKDEFKKEWLMMVMGKL